MDTKRTLKFLFHVMLLTILLNGVRYLVQMADMGLMISGHDMMTNMVPVIPRNPFRRYFSG